MNHNNGTLLPRRTTSLTRMWMGATALILSSSLLAAATSLRQTLDLAGPGWRAWMDKQAAWQNDPLVAPADVDVDKLPVNPPSGGWAALNVGAGRECRIPATVEELFSEGDNRWTYRGVTWFWRTVTIPAAWKGKVVRLGVAKANRRLEVLINQKLAAYDLVGEVPVTADVSRFLTYGAENLIAMRVTNPGGTRGWEDGPGVSWGAVVLPNVHEFAGIDGPVTLTATDPLFIEDVFVKNLLPAGERRAEVQITLSNRQAEDLTVKATVDICAAGTTTSLHRATCTVTAKARGSSTGACIIAVPKAKLWDLDSPNLYQCIVTIAGKSVADQQAVLFGFRTCELRVEGDRHQFFFNGRRIRQRSAIDWGFYGMTGFYATPEMAERSVLSAKSIGHNGINFHRRIGETRVMQAADRLGLYLYEEPGGFHCGGQAYDIVDGTFTAKLMEEKVRRMVLRDRNHPSLLMYSLCNEDNKWTPLRERVLRSIAQLDPTRLVINSSGGNGGGNSGPTPHFRPYESTLRTDYQDNHTVAAGASFQEGDLGSHGDPAPGFAFYWGEVRCYAGPADWYAMAAMYRKGANGPKGYGLNLYQPMADQLSAFFDIHRPDQSGSKRIRIPSEISRAAGSGLMYIDGRLSQSIMVNDWASGYAINGWSGGPQMPDAWDSAICDEGRHVKGPPADYAYWTRDCQIAILRRNGKYFSPGQTATFALHLINEGRLAKGPATMELTVTDGTGKRTGFTQSLPVEIIGGNVYAQALGELKVKLDGAWHGGHITVRGRLMRGGKVLTDGAEQVLLQNRPSFKAELQSSAGAVCGWPSAQQALDEAGLKVPAYQKSAGRLNYVVAGQVPEAAILDSLLERVKTTGTCLILKADKNWTDELFKRGILSQQVTQWGGQQHGGWNGNGWGYLEHVVGDQAVPSGPVISTNAWQAPDEPVGFAPFASTYRTRVYGVHVARPGAPAEQKVLTLLGTVAYGKGRIVLAPSYPVDKNNAFNDLLFYNLIVMSRSL
jgi:hypothetical protein